MIRELVRKGEKPRKELKLLSVQEDLYNYQVIAANSKAPGEKVWRVYNKRACCLPVRGTQTGSRKGSSAVKIQRRWPVPLDTWKTGCERPQDQAEAGGLVALQGGIYQSPYCSRLILFR
ncbi:MAG: hypothetical protein JRI33_05735 [Deltaproteobacteria bacterium]|nr:hypothetical protein [Deltaproteobacteria bacterium]